MRPLAESIERKIQPDGSLADDASPELSRIRREQERQQRSIEESLRSALRKLTGEGATQEDLITIRGERFVIPVRAELKRRVTGVIHGASSSGQTVYVEPLETIEQNNELVRLIEEEQEEIHRIFVALTRQVAGYAHSLVEGARVLALVDSLLARARFARAFHCVSPGFGRDLLLIEGGRHPLLEKRLRATGGTHCSAGSGADGRRAATDHQRAQYRRQNRRAENHGAAGDDGAGRNSGAGREASFPVFTAFLADIGDAQSIEAALSTFSAHITNLDRLSRLADARSLVLLDELGSATDPEEGAALAVAVAHAFSRGRRVDADLDASHFAQSLRGEHARRAQCRGGRGREDAGSELSVSSGRAGRVGGHPDGGTAGAECGDHCRGAGAAGLATGRHCALPRQAALRTGGTRSGQEEAREQQYALNQERKKLEREGDVEMRNRVRELEGKLASLMKEFEFQMRENVRAVEDRVAQQKLSKEAERRIQRLRREFQESFNQTVVAHRTGADQGDANAQPHVLRHIAPGDRVLHQVA